MPLGIPEQTDPRRCLHIPGNLNDDARICNDVLAHLRFNEDQVADLIGDGEKGTACTTVREG